MNILIIGKPRARTSYLGKCLSSNYKLEYLSEPYDPSAYMNIFYQRLKLLKSKNYENVLYDKQTEWLKGVTKSIFGTDNFVAKLFPRHITVDTSSLENYKFWDKPDSRYDSIPDPSSYKFKIITNLSEILQLKKFDKLYFIERNLIDSPISFAYSLRINQFGFSDNNKINEVKKKYSKITLTERDIPFINYLVFEHVLLLKIKKFIESNYACTFLTYDNVVNHINSNLNEHLDIDLIDPNFNYKEIITNYSEIEKHIHQVYDIFYPKLDDVNFT